MLGKIVIRKKNAILLLTFVVSLSISIGYFTAKGTALGDEKVSINNALEMQEFIEQEVDKGIDLKTIKREANKLGKKSRLYVAFVNSYNYNTTTVNIILDLDSKQPIVSSFEIEGK